MAPEESDFICRGWAWDSLQRELRVYKRERKRWSEKPEETVQLRDVEWVRWHRWAQAGRRGAESLSRIVVRFADGELALNENDRECAEKLASTLASVFEVAVEEVGAPGERLPGTTPSLDEMGRLASRQGRTETVVDTSAGEIVETTKKRFGLSTNQRRIPFGEVRRLELAHEVKGPMEEYRLTAVHGVEEQRVLVALYQGFEGWAIREEWQEFAESLGRTLGAEVT
jgi:hypothetical protein